MRQLVVSFIVCLLLSSCANGKFGVDRGCLPGAACWDNLTPQEQDMKRKSWVRQRQVNLLQQQQRNSKDMNILQSSRF